VNRALKVVLWVVIAGAVVVAAIQLVPYGRDHTNPPVTAAPTWDSPRTEELVRAACYDCHSNETEWPWYANVAPASWLLQWDVEGGRDHLNFSEWGYTPQEAASVGLAIEEVVREGEMPPWQYRLIHSGARLSDAEKDELIAGVKASLGR